jgi:hypothetical protein
VAATRLQDAGLELVNQVKSRIDELDAVEPPSGGKVPEQQGWPTSDTKSAVELLFVAQRSWATGHRSRHETSPDRKTPPTTRTTRPTTGDTAL